MCFSWAALWFCCRFVRANRCFLDWKGEMGVILKALNSIAITKVGNMRMFSSRCTTYCWAFLILLHCSDSCAVKVLGYEHKRIFVKHIDNFSQISLCNSIVALWNEENTADPSWITSFGCYWTIMSSSNAEAQWFEWSREGEHAGGDSAINQPII